MQWSIMIRLTADSLCLAKSDHADMRPLPLALATQSLPLSRVVNGDKINLLPHRQVWNCVYCTSALIALAQMLSTASTAVVKTSEKLQNLTFDHLCLRCEADGFRGAPAQANMSCVPLLQCRSQTAWAIDTRDT